MKTHMEQRIKEIARSFIDFPFFANPGGIEIICLFRKYIDCDYSSVDLLNEEKDRLLLVSKITGEDIDFDRSESFINDIFPKILEVIKEYSFIKNNSSDYVDAEDAASIGIAFKNKETKIILIVVMRKIEKEMTMMRFLSQKNKPRPIKSIEKYFNEKDYLIDITESTPLDRGFYLKEEGKVIYTDMDEELHILLSNLIKKNLPDCTVQVRLNEVGEYAKHNNISLAMEDKIFGLPFTVDNLSRVYKKEYGTYEYDFKNNVDSAKYRSFFYPLKALQYSIKPYDKNNLTLSVESMVDYDKDKYSKYSEYVFKNSNEEYIMNYYFHAIFDRKTYKVNHFDFSLLCYSFETYCERLENHLKDKPVSATFKVKKFRVDGDIEFKDFSQIFATSMGGKFNPEVEKFILGQ